MPICQKCTSPFPNRLVIEGQMKNLGSRKYCLTCSPWGQHNTRTLKDAPPRSCRTCPGTPNRNNAHCSTCLGLGHHLRRKDPEDLLAGGRYRKYLLRTRPLKCEVCDQDTWMGQPITLHSDHIDGNAANNVPENLRLICPNCHAQTPTYMNKNRGKGRPERRRQYRRAADR